MFSEPSPYCVRVPFAGRRSPPAVRDAAGRGPRRYRCRGSGGAANAGPLEIGWRVPFGVEGRPAARTDEEAIAQYLTVSTGYFETFRARLLAGRFFTDHDSIAAEPVVVVNETFARRVFP